VLPKEINDIFEEYSEDEYSLYVTKVDYSGSNFIINFTLDVQNINDKGAFMQMWSIEATKHMKNHISFDSAQMIKFKDDHPLLWEFTDIQCELYFSGDCKDTPKLFYDLYHTHEKLFDKHQNFNITFGEQTSNSKRFQYNNGLLAIGSKKLMKLYAECLKKNGLDFTIIAEHYAKHWNGQRFISEPNNLKILLLGDTFVIAENFSFEKLGENSR